jgi:CRP-like cAMP-binding protein
MTALATITQPLSRVPQGAIALSFDDKTAWGIPAAPTRYARNEEIFGEGDDADFVYRVKRGAVRLYRVLADGRRQIGAFHFAGDEFGFEMGAEHTFSAEAVCDCEVVAVPREAVYRKAEGDAGLSRQLWSRAIADLASARDHMLLLGRQTAMERVAAFLVEMADRNRAGATVTLPMSRQDIADYLGLTIETVSRTLTQLTDEGAIEIPTARTINLRNPSALRELNS